MRLPIRLVLSLAVAALLSFGALQLAALPRQAEAAATLGFPSVACGNDGTATVNFAWAPVAGQLQWVDLTIFDNNFEAGTFIGAGPLPNGQALLMWSGILTNVTHFWRVNTLTANGWEVSETGSFVPCGGPAVLASPAACTDRFNANVTFRWAPSTTGAGTVTQWLDIGFDASFPAGNFVGLGPLPVDLQSYQWPGIQANIWTYFRVNALGNDGVWRTSTTGAFWADCAGPINTNLYGSNDRLVVDRLGINAVVNVRDVGFDGALGDPAGPTDVVRYNFVVQEGYGGYPGYGGSTLLAGHVDYRNYGLAVFAGLRDVAVNDRIDFYRGDGVVVSYAVDWFADLPPDYDWNSLSISSNPESMTLITCNGDFNLTTREYSHRRVVHSTRIN